MADTYLNGTDWLLYLKISGTYKPVACLTTNDLNSTLTDIDVSSKCQTDGYFIPGNKHDQKITGSGFAIDQSGTPSKDSYDALYDLYTARTVVEAQFAPVSQATGAKFYQGNVFITNIKLTAPYNEAMKFDVEFRVQNPPLAQYAMY